MPAAPKPIQTSAPQLKDLLAKTGRSLKQKDHHDKLEVLGFLVEQINDKLKRGFKMKLGLADLNAFLSREGQEEHSDLKGCVSNIIQFVYHQHERLGQYVQPHEGKNRTDLLDSLLKLWAMESQHVDECFAIEVYSSPVSDGQKHERVAETGDAKAQSLADDRKCPGSSETPNSNMDIVAKLEHAAEATDAKVDALADDRERLSNSGTPNASMSIVVKHGHSVETTDAKVESPTDDRKRWSSIETQNSSTEIVVKRRRTDGGLLEAPVRARLFAEFKRLVPFDILAAVAIEDVAKYDAAADSLLERRLMAQAEVDRILKADSEGSSILPGETANERLASFRNIARLLHPDVGLVSEEDTRAIKALDLSLKSFVKSELCSGDTAR